MTIAGSTVLVSGANRGIGRALVEEVLARGAQRVYAGTRQPLTHPDSRVVPVELDVTDAASIRAAVEQITELDVLVNNAGVGTYEDHGDRGSLERHLSVNLFGTYDLTQALLPALTASRGSVVNVLSVAALASLPLMPAYSVSKAAALSMSQTLRAVLAPRGVGVHVVLAGPVDTDMVRDLELPKTAAEVVARGILDGVESGVDDIFPDPMSAAMADGWRSSMSKRLEGEFAALVQPVA
jgi:NAD(P)-dependent dehydrogenase (short-subunit alcohol dehydrogenase family)